MKSPRKTKNSNTLATISKTTKEDKDKEIQKKEQLDAKSKEKEAQFQKLEEYVNESGLALAFNIIFAELISKQILPENFFTYTSMRLKQIGKEIEGLKTNEEIPVEKNEDEQQPEVKEENIILMKKLKKNYLNQRKIMKIMIIRMKKAFY